MIHLLYGGDDLSMDEALLSMKADVTPAELRDVNVTVLNGSALRLDELSATCDTVPFLADRRMVIVEGLLGLFERGRPGVPTSRSPSRTLAAWDALPDYLTGMPQTTHLAFKELQLSESNPLLTRLRPLAEVLKFPLPSRNELQPWIRERAAKLGVEIEPRAVGTLAEAIGGDLRMIDQELQKLGLFCWGRTVLQVDVEQLVARVREASIFAAVDAVVEGRPGVALNMIHQLLDAGRAPIFILTMIARQVRLILLAEDLRGPGCTGVRNGQETGPLGISPHQDP